MNLLLTQHNFTQYENQKSLLYQCVLHGQASLLEIAAASMPSEKQQKEIQELKSTGETLMHMAVRNLNLECVNALCKLGANTAQKNKTGHTALDILAIEKNKIQNGFRPYTYYDAPSKSYMLSQVKNIEDYLIIASHKNNSSSLLILAREGWLKYEIIVATLVSMKRRKT
ncbi:MAG: ankyrin repeat domain-containing protein [Gammaproteobacteria bacterium]|nr:ankyrin repeat domain-containing protein [Gammaproteobacteria bacterium]